MRDKYPKFINSADHQQQQMARMGIRRQIADVFYYRDYRYEKLEDAVAEAWRDKEIWNALSGVHHR